MVAGRLLFITAVGFTKAEMEEVGRDWVFQIDLINGDQPVDKYKALFLWVNTVPVERFQYR